jgi:chromosomal replication initiator protein
VADILPASYDLRYEILKSKANELSLKYENKIQVTEDVIVFLAKTISNNVRELEGALNKVVTFANLMHKEVDVELGSSSS